MAVVGDLPSSSDELRGQQVLVGARRVRTAGPGRTARMRAGTFFKLSGPQILQADRPRAAFRLKPAAVERVVSAVVIALVSATLLAGWLARGQLDRWVNPEQGFGYVLGIVGGSMMLVLLGYPIRKRLRGPRRTMGSVGFWFRFHMLLGLLGPMAILYHARFTFGSFNSAMALAAMIVVAGSGLVGRFLYSRVHRGYSDRKLELRGLKQDMDGLLGDLSAANAPREVLQDFEHSAVRAGGAFASSMRAVVGLGLQSRLAERRLARMLPPPTTPGGQAARQTLAGFFVAVRRSAEFAFYDRLLRLWHLLHLPLFVVLVAAAILHIVAVHMY